MPYHLTYRTPTATDRRLFTGSRPGRRPVTRPGRPAGPRAGHRGASELSLADALPAPRSTMTANGTTSVEGTRVSV